VISTRQLGDRLVAVCRRGPTFMRREMRHGTTVGGKP
jgi:hypothetical protein